MRMRVKTLLLCVGVLASCTQESLQFEGEEISCNVEPSYEENVDMGNFIGVPTSTYQNVVQYLKKPIVREILSTI